MLIEGMKAPEFTLENQEGKKVSLADYKGHKVVVYFYPKDATPGCTTQACSFRDAYEDYKKLNVVVLGISKDAPKSHSNFATKQGLPFYLLSDTEGTTVEAYGVWQLKKMAGNEYMGIVRTTFLVDENGMIEKIYEKVKPEENAEEILSYLRS